MAKVWRRAFPPWPNCSENRRAGSGSCRAGGTMDWTNRRERFRATLGRGRCIHPASVYDPISARIAEDLGFEAGMLAGSVGLARGARRARHRPAHAHRIRRAGLSRQPGRQSAAAGRCRPRLRQCAQRQAHGRGTGNRGRCRSHDRGHLAAHALRRDRDQADPDRGGGRQDARGARRPPGPAPRHRRPHRRGHADRHCRHHRAAQGLRGRRRRHAVHGRREIARRARRDRQPRSSSRCSSAVPAGSSTTSTTCPRAMSASACRVTPRSWRRSMPCTPP